MRGPPSSHRSAPLCPTLAPRPQVRILLRSPLFKRLTLVMMLTGVVLEGLQDLLVQYLQLKLEGFGVRDVVRGAQGKGGFASVAIVYAAVGMLAGALRGGACRQPVSTASRQRLAPSSSPLCAPLP